MTLDSDQQTGQGVVGAEIDGRYLLDAFLGAGTMGSVYSATQLAVGRTVAVKILNAALQTNEEVRERFRVEAQAIASLSHPHCVTLFDFGYSEELGALYMVIEYLEGENLADRVARGCTTLRADGAVDSDRCVRLEPPRPGRRVGQSRPAGDDPATAGARSEEEDRAGGGRPSRPHHRDPFRRAHGARNA